MTVPTYTPPSALDDVTGQIRSALIEAMNVFLKRDFLLETEVDPIMSVPAQWDALTSDKKAAWTKYKSDLNAIVGREAWPSLVTWPNKPE